MNFARKQQYLAEREREVARQANALARRRLYSAQMSLALNAWQRGNVEVAVELLERQRPQGEQEDLRTFEWYYLWRLCHRDMVFRGHEGAVSAVAFFPGGASVASAGDDRTIRIWELATGRQTGVLRGHLGPVSCLAVSPDGRFLASTSDDRTVKLWDLETLQERRTLSGHTHKVIAAAFAPNGRLLATGSMDGTLRLWNVALGEAIGVYDHSIRGKPSASVVTAISFTPDGRFVLTGAELPGTGLGRRHGPDSGAV